MLCTQSPAVWAQTAEDRESARLLMDRGDEQVEKGDLDGALASYRAAHELMHVPTTGIELARIYVRLGKLVEARDIALEVTRMPTKPKDPRAFKVARAAAEDLARELPSQISSLRIQLTPEPAADQTALEIDQRSVPLSALGLAYALNPGEHRVQIAVRGYRTVVREVRLGPGETHALRVDLVPVPKPKVVAQKPPPPEPSAKPSSLSVAAPAPSGESPSWPQWVGFGLGGAGLVVGSIAGVLSLNQTRTAKDYCDGNVCSALAQHDRDSALTMANVSNVGFGVAVLGAGIGLTSWLLSGSTSEPQSSATALRGSATALHFEATPGVATVRLQGTLW